MHQVEPSVRLVGSTVLHGLDVEEWLDELHGRAVLGWISGSQNEQLIELAGRRCYKSYAEGLNPNVSRVRRDSAAYHANVLESGHGSVLEHAAASWALENVSRAFTHELVRHRVGTAFSQESLRYVRLTDLGFWMPPVIREDPEALERCTWIVEMLEQHQHWLAQHYAIENEPNFTRKKKLTSAFRRFAPMGLATGIVLTTNMRSLRWLIEQRTDRQAEEEMRLVLGKIAAIAKDTWPLLFGDFTATEVDGAMEWVPAHHKV